MPESSQEPNTHQEEPASPEPSAGDQSLRRAIELITSLISLSHSIRTFSIKWQSIRARLEDLLSGLAAVEASGTGENPLLSGEIPAILSTLDDCHSLSDQCLDLSYSGKLLMQSDLDIIGSKLDSHLKNLSSICTNGIMKERYAIVASRPGIGASKEDVRFYVKDLLARVKVGGSELRKQALVAFNEVIQEDERYVKVAVEVGSFFGALVSFLEFEEAEVQEEAALAVSVIAGFEIYKSVLIGAGVIGPLIQVLETGSEMAKERCTRCLMKLTVNSDNAWSVSAHGGVTALLKICAGCDCGGELVGLACGVLRNLVGVEEIKKFMVEEGAISTFVRLLKSKDEVSLIHAIEFLQMMASADDSIRLMIVKEDGARLLLRVLDPKYSFILKSRLVALCGIMNLCFTSVFSLSILMDNGFLDHILYFLRNGELSIQELALKAVFKLCEKSEEWNKAMGELGFMPELVKLLDSKSFEVRELAAESLLIMISIPRNRKRFVQNEENVDMILKLLDPDEGNSGNRNLLLSILTPLTSCHSARKKIVHSGYMKHMEKLAEAEDSDAQRIVKKLSSNRLRSMWSGIWHS